MSDLSPYNVLLTKFFTPRALRSYEINVSMYILTTDRPTTDLSFQKFQMAISPQPVVRSTPCLVLGWGFLGWRIEWRYFRFDQIQDSGGRHLGKISNGHISAMAHDLLIQRASRGHLCDSTAFLYKKVVENCRGQHCA